MAACKNLQCLVASCDWNACLTAENLISGGGRELLMCQGSDTRTATNIADTLLPKDHAKDGPLDTKTVLHNLEEVILVCWRLHALLCRVLPFVCTILMSGCVRRNSSEARAYQGPALQKT